LEQQVRKVQLATQARKGHKDLKDCKELLAYKDLKEYKDRLEMMVLPAHRV